jgi:hypothetical protein
MVALNYVGASSFFFKLRWHEEERKKKRLILYFIKYFTHTRINKIQKMKALLFLIILNSGPIDSINMDFSRSAWPLLDSSGRAIHFPFPSSISKEKVCESCFFF